ncbi:MULTISPECIES: cold-shock protein [unclassified Nocardioides]|uniref:cold-shock protein n=1 Tax=unclassified Nocardioides TaxID=2615069 RepID=UPI001153C176|nr:MULTISPECIES: cold shock domain-containing protein [unclassified Nocardioides]TQK69950.1 CspA family cold shock protein [Nocardioides sp. SLBN-35]WGY00813.1 cold shock domain-containing protein [Nocardioides sp. QY071]
MRVQGTVRLWHDEEGWGVFDSPETPGGCWAHFSAVDVPGFKTLKPGDRVDFDFEAADQDGFAFLANNARPI